MRTECGNVCGSQDLQTHLYWRTLKLSVKNSPFFRRAPPFAIKKAHPIGPRSGKFWPFRCLKGHFVDQSAAPCSDSYPARKSKIQHRSLPNRQRLVQKHGMEIRPYSAAPARAAGAWPDGYIKAAHAKPPPFWGVRT